MTCLLNNRIFVGMRVKFQRFVKGKNSESGKRLARLNPRRGPRDRRRAAAPQSSTTSCGRPRRRGKSPRVTRRRHGFTRARRPKDPFSVRADAAWIRAAARLRRSPATIRRPTLFQRPPARHLCSDDCATSSGTRSKRARAARHARAVL